MEWFSFPNQPRMGFGNGTRSLVISYRGIYNKCIVTWMGGQYDEVLYSCIVFSLAFGLGKYLHTRAVPHLIALSSG